MNVVFEVVGSGLVADLATLALARFGFPGSRVDVPGAVGDAVTLDAEDYDVLARWALVEPLGGGQNSASISGPALRADIQRRLDGFGLVSPQHSRAQSGFRVEVGHHRPLDATTVGLDAELSGSPRRIERLAWRIAGGLRGWFSPTEPVAASPLEGVLALTGGMRFAFLVPDYDREWGAAVAAVADVVPIELATVGPGERLELDQGIPGGGTALIAPDGIVLGQWPQGHRRPSRALRDALTHAGVVF